VSGERKREREAARFEKGMERDRMTNGTKYLLPAADAGLIAAEEALAKVLEAVRADTRVAAAKRAVEEATAYRAAAIQTDRQTRLEEGDVTAHAQAAEFREKKRREVLAQRRQAGDDFDDPRGGSDSKLGL